MKIVKVSGKDERHKVFVYALSTCAWCKLVKNFLKDNGVSYEYVDVDLSDENDREEIRRKIMNNDKGPVYPTIVVDAEKQIIGFRKNEIKEALEI